MSLYRRSKVLLEELSYSLTQLLSETLFRYEFFINKTSYNLFK